MKNGKASLTAWMIMFFALFAYHMLVTYPLTRFAIRDLGKGSGFAVFFAAAFIALDIIWVGRIFPPHIQTPGYMAFIWSCFATINAGLVTYALFTALSWPINWGLFILIGFCVAVLRYTVVIPIYFAASRLGPQTN